MAYTAAETPVLLASLTTFSSTDCTEFLSKGMLFGTSIWCGKLSNHLIQFLRRKVGSSLFQGNFKLPACLYMFLPIGVTGDIMSRGSKMDATNFNVSCFVFWSLLQRYLSFCPMLLLRFWSLANLHQAPLLQRWCQVECILVYFLLLDVSIIKYVGSSKFSLLSFIWIAFRSEHCWKTVL